MSKAPLNDSPANDSLESEDLFASERCSKAKSEIELLFREHNEALVKFLRGRLRSEAEAREAAQEAYVRLLQLDHPEKISFLRAYLYKIATNVATDVLRRRRLQERTQSLPDEYVETAVAPAHERAMDALDQLQVIESVLRELPARCREAFILRRQEGWSTTRIARHLGVSDRMVRLYLVSALEQIEQVTTRLGYAKPHS